MIFEQLAAVRVGDHAWTVEFRRRYLAMHLETLLPRAGQQALPATAPSVAELGERWVYPNRTAGTNASATQPVVNWT